MKTRKSISFAYWSSPTAAKLGCAETGCFYVAVSVLRKDGNWSPFSPAHNAEGFDSPTHPDLLASFKETEGEICPLFRYLRAHVGAAPLKPQK
jgi:hypothetical protein